MKLSKKKASKWKFLCKLCSLPLASNFSLKRHQAVCQSKHKHKPWKCNYNSCNLFFFKSAALQKHLSVAHDKEYNDGEEFRFQCEICSRYFSAKKILNHHSETCKTFNKDSKRKWTCYVDQCQLRFHKAVDLKKHLMNAHNRETDSETLNFLSYQEFLKWKEQEEEKTYSYFSKHNKIIKRDKTLYERFVCQNHGTSKPHKQQCLVKNLRQNKKGRIKTNKICLSQMIVTSNKDGRTKVEYSKTHSHPLNPENVVHHPTPKKIRDKAIDLLSLGYVPQDVEKMLENVQTTGKHVTRTINLKNLKYLHGKLCKNNSKLTDDVTEALVDITSETINFMEEDCEKILGPVLFDEKEIERSEMRVRLDKIDQYLENIVSLRNKLNVDSRSDVVEFVETSLCKIENMWENMMKA